MKNKNDIIDLPIWLSCKTVSDRNLLIYLCTRNLDKRNRDWNRYSLGYCKMIMLFYRSFATCWNTSATIRCCLWF